jgi:hypothetical protein
VLRRYGGGVYSYRSVRRGRRVVTEYLGAGPAAVLAEAVVVRDRAFWRKLRRAERRMIGAAVGRLEAVGRVVTDVSDRINIHFRDAMHLCGWYVHQWSWRKRGVSVANNVAWDPKVLEDARKDEAARRLFAQAADVPALVERLGGRMATRVKEGLVRRMSSDAAVREAFRREAEALRKDLEGPDPTVVERLVCERIIIAWLHVHWLDLLYFGPEEGFTHQGLEAHVARLRSRANRDYLASLKCLSLIRKAAPQSVTVNISKTVNVDRKRGAKGPPAGNGAP